MGMCKSEVTGFAKIMKNDAGRTFTRRLFAIVVVAILPFQAIISSMVGWNAATAQYSSMELL